MNTPEPVNANTKHREGVYRAALPASAALLRLYPSKFYQLSLIFLHLASMLSIWLAALPIIFQAALLVLLLSSLHRHRVLWQRFPTVYLHQRAAEQWVLQSENNVGDFVTIHSCYYRSSWLIILRLKPETPAHSLAILGTYYPIFRDSCAQDRFRHVTVVAKYFLNSAVA